MGTRRPQALADTDAGEKPLGELIDVIETASDPAERELVADGGEGPADESPGHASAVVETLRQADDEDLEAAGIGPDAVDDEEVADGER